MKITIKWEQKFEVEVDWENVSCQTLSLIPIYVFSYVKLSSSQEASASSLDGTISKALCMYTFNHNHVSVRQMFKNTFEIKVKAR